MRGSFQTVSRSLLQATSRTEPAQRLDIRKGPEDVSSTHPIIVKDAVADLHQDIPSCLLECQLHVLSRARASLDEQQSFLFCPQRSLFGCHLSISLSRSNIIRTQVGFVADQDARQVRVRVLTNVPEPCPGIQETWDPARQHCIGWRLSKWGELTDSAANRRHRRASNQLRHDNMIWL